MLGRPETGDSDSVWSSSMDCFVCLDVLDWDFCLWADTTVGHILHLDRCGNLLGLCSHSLRFIRFSWARLLAGLRWTYMLLSSCERQKKFLTLFSQCGMKILVVPGTKDAVTCAHRAEGSSPHPSPVTTSNALSPDTRLTYASFLLLFCVFPFLPLSCFLCKICSGIFVPISRCRAGCKLQHVLLSRQRWLLLQ